MNASGTRKDYIIVSVIGLFFGLFLIVVLGNLNLPFISLNALTAIIIVAGFIIFANIALRIAFFAGRKVSVVPQFAKFAAAGSANTALDIGILNGLMFITVIAAGYWYAVFKAISFAAAVVSSYFLNRYWTFETKTNASTKEFGQFLVVSLIGLVVNVSVASLLVVKIGSPFESITQTQWATASALCATFVALIWNFLGYKFIVFKDKGAIAGKFQS